MDGSTGDDTRLDDTDGGSPAGKSRLEAVVVRYRDRPDRCTIAPRDDTAAGTAWLTADIGAFVDLGNAR